MALSLLDAIQGQPGMNLPVNTQQPYSNDIGNLAGPNDILSLLTGQQMQPSQAPQQQMQDIPLTGNASTFSDQIQQALGAKQQDQGGQIQDILAGRFQPPPFSLNDVGVAAQQTAASGQYVPAQGIANQRTAAGFDMLDRLGKLQQEQAQANYYNAVAQNGGGKGEALALLNKLNNDPSTANLDLATKLTMVKAGLGVGNTMVNGAVQPIQGNLNTVQQTAQAKSTGEEIPKLQYAAPIESQKVIGTAQGNAKVGLANAQASMPQMYNTIGDLEKLAQAATYTVGGQAYNSVVRQLGLPMTEGANARAEFMSRVNNYLIPSLKQNFGNRITNMEINAQKNMFADPNLSPSEKIAQFKAFVAQKEEGLSTDQGLVSALGATPIQGTENNQTQSATSSSFQEGQTATNPQTGQKLTFRNGQWQ